MSRGLVSYLCAIIAMDKLSEKKLNKPKQKQYYTVKIEAVAPVILTYKVLAETPEEAGLLAVKLRGQQQTAPPIIFFAKLSNMTAKIYKAGTSMLELTKKF